MSQQSDNGYKGFIASGAITIWTRVKINSDGTVSTAGLTDKDIGVAQATVADTERVNVKLRSAPGTHKMTAAGAITRGAQISTQASGKVDDAATATGYVIGQCLETATANGDIVECLYNNHGDSALP